MWLEEWGYMPGNQNPAMDSMQAVKIAKIASIAEWISVGLFGPTGQVEVIRTVAYVHL